MKDIFTNSDGKLYIDLRRSLRLYLVGKKKSFVT